MAKLYCPDGTEMDVKPKGAKFTLKELQTLIGGYIEVVPRTTAVVDEDGITKNLDFNYHCSALYARRLLGNVVVLSPTEFKKFMS